MMIAEPTIMATILGLDMVGISRGADSGRAGIAPAIVHRHPEVLARSASLEGCRPRRPGRRPSRLASLAPQGDGLRIARNTSSGVIGICVIGAAPSGRNASFTAIMMQAGAPAVPASPAPLAPSSE